MAEASLSAYFFFVFLKAKNSNVFAILRQKKGKRKEKHHDQNWSCFFAENANFASLKAAFCLKVGREQGLGHVHGFRSKRDFANQEHLHACVFVAAIRENSCKSGVSNVYLIHYVFFVPPFFSQRIPAF